MNGRELIAALEREGFTIKRRSTSYVWVERDAEMLMVDEDGDVEDDVAWKVLQRAREVR